MKQPAPRAGLGLRLRRHCLLEALLCAAVGAQAAAAEGADAPSPTRLARRELPRRTAVELDAKGSVAPVAVEASYLQTSRGRAAAKAQSAAGSASAWNLEAAPGHGGGEVLGSRRVTVRTLVRDYSLPWEGPATINVSDRADHDLTPLLDASTGKLLEGTFLSIKAQVNSDDCHLQSFECTADGDSHGLSLHLPHPVPGASGNGSKIIYQRITDAMYKLPSGKKAKHINWKDMRRLKLHYGGGAHCRIHLSEVRFIAPVTTRVLLPSYTFPCCTPRNYIHDLGALGGEEDLSGMIDHSTGLLRPSTTLSMTVTMEHAMGDHGPLGLKYVKYTKDWSTGGIAFDVVPKDGHWHIGENQVSVPITPGLYKLAKGAPAQSIPWASMSRMVLYGHGDFKITNMVLRSNPCQDGYTYVPYAAAPECQDYGCCIRPPPKLPLTLVSLPKHPRIRMSLHDFQRMRLLTHTDPVAKHYCGQLLSHAEKNLADSNRKMELEQLCRVNGGRMLRRARWVLDSVATLSLAFKLSQGDRMACGHAVQDPKVFSNAAIAYLLAVTNSNCSGWNPKVFIDAAEMLHAVALGYDWLYDEMTPKERETVEKGAMRLGLQPGLDAFQTYSSGGWPVRDNYWNLVGNGALLAGALAFGDVGTFAERWTATEVYRQALAHIHIGLASYAPDGVWYEGPGYWSYATSYALVGMSSLSTALGTDGDLSKSPGFERTGLFRMDVAGPAGTFFDFADSRQLKADTWHRDIPVMYGLARLLGAGSDPLAGAYAAWASSKLPAGASFPCDAMACANALMMYEPAVAGASRELGLQQRTVALYHMAGGRGDDVGFIRSAFNDSKAAWVGFKGGWARRSHSDADAGTFVLDMAGENFIVDSGMENHEIRGVSKWNLPDSQGRSYLYSKTTCGHNTLTFDSKCEDGPESIRASNQDVDEVADVTTARAGPGFPSASVRLTPVYRGAELVFRGFALVDSFQQLLMVDEIKHPTAQTVTWAVHTRARVQLVRARDESGKLMAHGDKGHCLLRQGKEYIHVKVVEPHGAHFHVSSLYMRPPQKSSDGLQRLSLTVPLERFKATRIVVALGTTDKSADYFQDLLVKMGPPTFWGAKNSTV